jgi:hypothetical protein
MDPKGKLAALYADLGINPAGPNAADNALLELATRHVPGFRIANAQSRKKPGRKKGLEKRINEITQEFGPLFGGLAEDSAKLDLYALVDRAQRSLKGPGGRRLTKSEIVRKISKQAPGPGFENPYYGIAEATLLSWVTHAGPNSKIQKAREKRMAAAIAQLKNFLGR